MQDTHDTNLLLPRRTLLGLLAAAAGSRVLPVLAQEQAEQRDQQERKYTQFLPEDGHLRPMHIHRLRQLGLEVWSEAEPQWDTELLPGGKGAPPVFTLSSPDNYHPPAATTITAWRRERVPGELFETMADTAIRTASANYGLNKGQARAIPVVPRTWGLLAGHEGDFSGRAQGQRLDVKIFVGQQEGKYPVVAQIYTQAGKMADLQDVIRRCWSNITYL